MKIHTLKTHPGPFLAVRRREKLHEVRRNDRDFQEEDLVVLMEWDPKTSSYSGRAEIGKIGHLSEGGTWGLPDDLCVFTFHPLGMEIR